MMKIGFYYKNELLGRIEQGYWDDSDIAKMKEALTGYNKR